MKFKFLVIQISIFLVGLQNIVFAPEKAHVKTTVNDFEFLYRVVKPLKKFIQDNNEEGIIDLLNMYALKYPSIVNYIVNDRNQESLLHWAILHGNIKLAWILLNLKHKNGKPMVNIHHANKVGSTALMLASVKGYLFIVQKLLDQGAEVNHRNQAGFTALIFAAEQGHKSVVKELLKSKAIVSFKNNKNDTALDRARLRNFTEIIELLEDRISSEL